MNVLVLVIDDEPEVEALFRNQAQGDRERRDKPIDIALLREEIDTRLAQAN